MSNLKIFRELVAKTMCLVLLLAGVSLPAGQAYAQSGTALEEITVVARRIAENLQDVPVSVTVMGSDYINDQRLFTVDQALALTPGSTLTMFNKTQFAFSLRGINSQTEGAAGDPAIVTVSDEVVISRDFAKSFEFFDVDRLEILRGPQGTAFGRNASGGLIHVVSKKPTHESESSVELTAGDYSLFGMDAVTNGSLSDQVAGRLSVHFNDRDGYTEDLSTGRKLDGAQKIGIRGQLLFTPSERLDLLLKLGYSRDDDGVNVRKGPDCTIPYLDFGPLFFQEPSCDPWETDIVDGVPLFLEREIFTASANIGWEFGDSLTLTSITAYIDAESSSQQSLFGTPFELAMGRSSNDAYQFNQEVRVDNSLQDGRLTWLAGVFYLHDNHKRNDDRDLVANTIFPRDTFQIQESENTTDSLGIYGELNYDLSDSTNFTVGGRYSKDDKDFDVGNAITGPFAPLLISPADNPISESVSDSWSKFTGSASISHRFNDDVMVYFTASQGYKSGGFNGEPETVVSALTPYDPETVLNLEVGIKGEWLDNRLRTNITVFHMDVDDLQVAEISASGAPIIANAGGSKAQGLELEYAFAVTDQFIFSGSAAWIDAELEGNFGGEDVTGNRPGNVPEWTAVLAATYQFPLSSGAVLSLRGDYQGRSDVFVGSNENIDTVRNSIGIFGARISWASPDGLWDLSLWGKNLGDEAKIIQIGPDVLTTQHPTGYGPPSRWGLTARRSF